jgi:hypothetical protein
MEQIKLNPIEMINRLFNVPENTYLSHVIFDKDVIPEYHIIRESKHDGTMAFTFRVISKALEPIVNMQSYNKATLLEDLSSLKAINYTVGEIELQTEFGMVDLPIGNYPGQTDVVKIPVKCEYIFE